MCVYVYVCVYMNMYICMYVCIYVHLCVCVIHNIYVYNRGRLFIKQYIKTTSWESSTESSLVRQ